MFVLLKQCGDKERERIYSYQCETLGEVIERVAVKNGFDSKVRFVIDSDTIITYIPHSEGDVDSEKYIVKYDCSNYKDFGVLKSQPMFLSNERVDSTYAVVKNVLVDGSLKIQYAYKDVVFEKIVRLPKHEFRAGDVGKVYLWVDNPQRVIFGRNYNNIIYTP